VPTRPIEPRASNANGFRSPQGSVIFFPDLKVRIPCYLNFDSLFQSKPVARRRGRKRRQIGVINESEPKTRSQLAIFSL
jgi:hypothetical protein